MTSTNRCPECPERDPNACILTFVDLVQGYIEEPAVFELDGFPHVHDPNPLIATWRCKSGHHFKISATRPCSGCRLEKESQRKAQREDGDRSSGMMHPTPHVVLEYFD
ncbi:hypothetical protein YASMINEVIRUS_568 [Yasminevirus sp. GU-2018]|uniref:Uncharacterized protein n=1 Tax=Yasminevirus sp. GU-2018 TaxID=2420051 RepID=A0A5K0U8I6_9VIRU|nr:hypothetical protein YASMINEVIRUS_568 [Yasminevirus sp. GU-2018]